MVSDFSLKKFKDIHLGKRAFIIGNGPSLSASDLDLLKDEITFAANKIYLAYESTKWRPTYYAVEDKLVMVQNFEIIKSLTGSIKFFPEILNKWVHRIENAYYFNMVVEEFFPQLPKFSYNFYKCSYWGSTIIYTMIQLATFMGIRELYLIGVDFDFFVPDKRDEKDSNILICQGERNHFHPDYRKPGEQWFVPNLHVSGKSFQKAKAVIEEGGGSIYNATHGGKLEIFQRAKFESLFK